MKSTKRSFPLILCLLGTSVCLVVCGITLFFIWPALLDHIIDHNMILTPQSHAYHLWKKFPEALPIDFYFFNWTNPEDIHDAAVKPKFKEVGPYRFLETKEKDNVTWNNNGTVTFKHRRFWFYDDKHVNGDVQDRITTVNPVALAAIYSSRTWSYFMRSGLSMSWSSMVPEIYLTRTVSQMLFEGYPDRLINVAKTLPFLAGSSIPPWDKFGWFYTRNGSSDYEGVFNMGTGVNSSFGRLYSWNHWTRTPYYEDNCAKVNGSAGEFFQTHLKKDSISLFSSDLCRTMTLRFAGENRVGNMLGYKYAIDDYMLDNGSLMLHGSG